MTNRFSKGAASLCVAVMLMQPVGAAFAADQSSRRAAIRDAALSGELRPAGTIVMAEAGDKAKERREERKKRAQKRRENAKAQREKRNARDEKPKRAQKNQRNAPERKRVENRKPKQAEARKEKAQARQQQKKAAKQRQERAAKQKERRAAQQRKAKVQERNQRRKAAQQREERAAKQRRQRAQQERKARAETERNEKAQAQRRERAREQRQKRATGNRQDRDASRSERTSVRPQPPTSRERAKRENRRARETDAARRDNSSAAVERRNRRQAEAKRRLQRRDRDARHSRPAAARRHDDFAHGRDVRAVRVRDGDVRRSNQDSRRWRESRERDRWRDHDRDRDWRRDRDRDHWDDRRRHDGWRWDDDDDDGLSDLETFGLVALGAVAVGAIIYGSQQVVSNDGDRVVTRGPQGNYNVYRDDDALIRRPGSTVYTDPYDDGSVQSRVVMEDGTVVYTVRDVDGRVLSRSVQRPDRPQVVLYDDTQEDFAPAPERLPPRSPVAIDYDERTDIDLLYGAFETEPAEGAAGRYSLGQIRENAGVRYLAPEVSLTSLGFAPGSSAVAPEAAQSLGALGGVMRDIIESDPTEVFLIEGHSDATGAAAGNIRLSDERAESVALALTENFGVPPENLVIQGYGESDLRAPTQAANEINRRVVIRRITPLLVPPPEDT